MLRSGDSPGKAKKYTENQKKIDDAEKNKEADFAAQNALLDAQTAKQQALLGLAESINQQMLRPGDSPGKRE
jgi:hypothetical protein